ncbi:MAG: PP2C family protein-serine/threonine phosphatase [Gammaproteobacteria bacterium]
MMPKPNGTRGKVLREKKNGSASTAMPTSEPTAAPFAAFDMPQLGIPQPDPVSNPAAAQPAASSSSTSTPPPLSAGGGSSSSAAPVKAGTTIKSELLNIGVEGITGKHFTSTKVQAAWNGALQPPEISTYDVLQGEGIYAQREDNRSGQDRLLLAQVPDLSQLKDPEKQVPAILERSFKRLQAETAEQEKEGKIPKGFGSTACVAVSYKLPDGKAAVTVASLGDSSAYVVDNAGGHKLTNEHTLENPKELVRCEQSKSPPVNGRVGGKLAVSRALGDTSFEQGGLSHDPEIKTHVFNGPGKLFMGCDRVCVDTSMKKEDVAEACRSEGNAPKPTNEEIVSNLLKRPLTNPNGLDDDKTALLSNVSAKSAGMVYGVFDGHGGQTKDEQGNKGPAYGKAPVADIAQQRLATIIKQETIRENLKQFVTGITKEASTDSKLSSEDRLFLKRGLDKIPEVVYELLKSPTDQSAQAKVKAAIAGLGVSISLEQGKPDSNRIRLEKELEKYLEAGRFDQVPSAEAILSTAASSTTTTTPSPAASPPSTATPAAASSVQQEGIDTAEDNGFEVVEASSKISSNDLYLSSLPAIQSSISMLGGVPYSLKIQNVFDKVSNITDQTAADSLQGLQRTVNKLDKQNKQNGNPDIKICDFLKSAQDFIKVADQYFKQTRGVSALEANASPASAASGSSTSPQPMTPSAAKPSREMQQAVKNFNKAASGTEQALQATSQTSAEREAAQTKPPIKIAVAQSEPHGWMTSTAPKPTSQSQPPTLNS